MKRFYPGSVKVAAAVLGLGATVAFGQLGPGRGGPAGSHGPNFTGGMTKVFGNHTGFTSDLEIQSGPDGEVKMPGKLAFSDGKSRLEMDVTKARQSAPSAMKEQMKALGMEQMIIITRPDRKVQYSINPALKAYVEQPLTGGEATKSPDDFTMASTLITREEVQEHDCEKNRVEITDKEGNKQMMTVWNARDLDKFPVKIEQTQNGQLTTTLFKEVKLTKPDGLLFEPPGDFRKYNSYPEMFRSEMMKNYKGGQRVPGEPRAPEPPRQ